MNTMIKITFLCIIPRSNNCLITMYVKKFTGSVSNEIYCVWCCFFYPESYFRQTIDICQSWDDFHMRHYYDQGNFFVRDVDGDRFRVFASVGLKITDKEIRKRYKEMTRDM